MAKVIGFNKKKISKKFTCYKCGAIVEYLPEEVVWGGRTDEGVKIVGLNCPNCNTFHRTNQ